MTRTRTKRQIEGAPRSGVGFTRSAWAMIVIILSAVLVAGCSSTTSGKSTSSSSNPAPGSSSPAPSTSAAPVTTAAASGCGNGAVAGQGGILHVFCGGTGDAKIMMGSASKELTGGMCVEQSGQFTINFGAVAGPDFPAGQTKPDYLGALVDDSNATLNGFTIIIDGVSSGAIVSRTATVSADKKTVVLKGKRLSDSADVAVNVTC